MVYLITGKSGAGKTHYAQAMAQELLDEGLDIQWIDGDVFRLEMENQDYSDYGRLKNLLAAAIQAQYAERIGKIVIVSFIAPKKVWRDQMRKHWYQSRVIYLPGGSLWEGTEYEKPTEDELWPQE